MPELEDEEYEIGYIVDCRWRTYASKPVFEFLIHWKGYSKADRTWTLADQLEDDDPPVVEFYKKYPNKPRRTQRTIFSLTNRAQPSATTKKTSSTVPSKPKPSSRSMPTAPRKESSTDTSGKENRRREAKPSSPESDDDFVIAVEDSDDESFKSDVEEMASEAEPTSEEDDVEEREYYGTARAVLIIEPVQRPKKTNGGWGTRIKGKKKPDVKL